MTVAPMMVAPGPFSNTIPSHNFNPQTKTMQVHAPNPNPSPILKPVANLYTYLFIKNRNLHTMP